MRKIDVLDHGYVRLVTYTPWNMVDIADYIQSGEADLGVLQSELGNDDLAFVNAAKASFQKESVQMDAGAIKLEKSLAKYFETLPFRHALITLEVACPYMVMRQWNKYTVGSEHGPNSSDLVGVPQELLDWLGDGGDDYKLGGDTFSVRSEASRRYLTIEPEFYIPKTEGWRGKPDNKKAGSQGVVHQVFGQELTSELGKHVEQSMKLYNWALEGACAEQARLFLPFYAMYVHWRWSASLQAITHFLNQRLEHKAQYEIQLYAQAVYDLVQPIYPYAIKFLVDKDYS